MTELFPDEDYRFHFRFERGRLADFFRPSAAHDQILAERRRWLKASPQTYAALLPEGVPLLHGTIELGHAEKALPGDFPPQESTTPSSPYSVLLELGATWEPDFLFLKPDS